MHRDWIRTIALAAMIALGLAAFFSLHGLEAAELPTLEVGFPEDGVFGLGGQYIIDKQLDRKNGFIVKPRWAGVPEIQRLMGIGAIQLGLAVSEVSLRANLGGTPIRLVQPYQVPHIFVLVPKDSPYKDVLDLKGKAIALTGETTSLYNMFDYIMKKRGVNIESDYKLKKLGAPVIIAVLEKGEVDGAVLWEAHVSRLLVSGKYRTILGFREEMEKLLKGEVVFLNYVGAVESWIKQNPEMISKIRATWAAASRGVQEDEAHFQKYAKRFFGLENPDEISLAWKRTRPTLAPADLKWPNPSGLEAQRKYLREATDLGIFPKEAKEIVDKLFVP
ncbi:ABC transporter substrate-binding protein [bacterium]|nr:MAG: ABC transporter substrate-binding protein [bacterium]